MPSKNVGMTSFRPLIIKPAARQDVIRVKLSSLNISSNNIQGAT